MRQSCPPPRRTSPASSPPKPIASSTASAIATTVRAATPAFLGLVCSDRGAEALEIAFVRLSHRLDLAGEQQPLFDALRTKALTTQTSFADDCKAALPDRSAGTRPDLLDRLKSTLAIEEARLTALNAVLPEFEAFYGSLTDAQKDDLLPRRHEDA